MQRFANIMGARRPLLVLALGLTLVACQQDNRAITDKLDQISQRLDSIDQQLKSGAGARGGAQGAAAARPPARPTPHPDKVYSVPVDGSPYKGPEHAKVTIVKASEFACPFCLRVRPTLDQLREKYGNDIRIVYKNLLVHPQIATVPALATCAAHKQGKFAQMEPLIWDKGFSAGRNLSQENMEKLAQEIGLNMEQFKKDMAGPECKAMVERDQAEVRRVGAGGTPSFFINGRFLSGARPAADFERIIDEELKKANEAIAKGTPVEKYYAEYVVKNGLKSLE